MYFRADFGVWTRGLLVMTFLAAGCDGFLAKPFRIDELLDMVASLAPEAPRASSDQSVASG